MSEVIALSASRDQQCPLNGFNTVRVLRLTLDRGLWLVFGKLSIENFDPDPQNAGARLRLAGDDVDHTEVRIHGNPDANVQAVALQAAVEVEEGRVPMDITAATFSGVAVLAKLAAIKLDQLNPDL